MNGRECDGPMSRTDGSAGIDVARDMSTVMLVKICTKHLNFPFRRVEECMGPT